MPIKDAISLPQVGNGHVPNGDVTTTSSHEPSRYGVSGDVSSRYGALSDIYYSGGEFSDDDDTFTDAEPDTGMENQGYASSNNTLNRSSTAETSSNATINTAVRDSFADSGPTFVTFSDARRSFGEYASVT